MKATNLSQIRSSYNKVGTATDERRARQNGWCGARDAAALDRVLTELDDDALIVDFGCCGLPWATKYLEDAGYNVVGIDVPKPRWRDYSLSSELNIDLVEYDGHNVPLSDRCASLVLMFGVLEHIGVWKDSGEKYAEPNEQIQTHRRKVLEEVSRITEQDGTLLVTKFPNKHGLDKLYLPDGGHLNSERTTESKLRDLLSNSFTVESVFQTGFIPYRLPCDAPTDTVARVFAQVDGTLSSTYPFSAVAQSYGAVATPKP